MGPSSTAIVLEVLIAETEAIATRAMILTLAMSAFQAPEELAAQAGKVGEALGKLRELLDAAADAQPL